MEKHILMLFSFIVVFAIVGLIFMIGPNISAMGTYGGGMREGYATQVLVKDRIVKAHGGDGVPRETVLRKGALESFGGGACPPDYRLATRHECLFVNCIPVSEDYQRDNPGKLCKPLPQQFPVYPEDGVLK
ncbi:hypothetical protein GF358_03880 [Candidatus Woesearchaeota archaeon]|nr:hypothetical protein [Candidatus Woesearchaeota archaeon]